MTITGGEHSAGEGRRRDMQRSPKPAPAGAGPGAAAGVEVGEGGRPGGVGGVGEVGRAVGRRRRGPRVQGQRQVRVGLRVSGQEAGLLQQAADRTGMTVAGYAAAAALAAAGGTAPPRALPAADRRSRELLGALVAARFELARVGVNLNQLARSANIDGTVLPEQLGAVLARVDAGVRLLDDRTVQVLSPGRRTVIGGPTGAGAGAR